MAGSLITSTCTWFALVCSRVVNCLQSWPQSVQPAAIIVGPQLFVTSTPAIARCCFKSLGEIFQSQLEFVVSEVWNPRCSGLQSVGSYAVWACGCSRSTTVREGGDSLKREWIGRCSLLCSARLLSRRGGNLSIRVCIQRLTTSSSCHSALFKILCSCRGCYYFRNLRGDGISIRASAWRRCSSSWSLHVSGGCTSTSSTVRIWRSSIVCLDSSYISLLFLSFFRLLISTLCLLFVTFFWFRSIYILYDIIHVHLVNLHVIVLHIFTTVHLLSDSRISTHCVASSTPHLIHHFLLLYSLVACRSRSSSHLASLGDLFIFASGVCPASSRFSCTSCCLLIDLAEVFTAAATSTTFVIFLRLCIERLVVSCPFHTNVVLMRMVLAVCMVVLLSALFYWRRTIVAVTIVILVTCSIPLPLLLLGVGILSGPCRRLSSVCILLLTLRLASLRRSSSCISLSLSLLLSLLLLLRVALPGSLVEVDLTFVTLLEVDIVLRENFGTFYDLIYLFEIVFKLWGEIFVILPTWSFINDGFDFLIFYDDLNVGRVVRLSEHCVLLQIGHAQILEHLHPQIF